MKTAITVPMSTTVMTNDHNAIVATTGNKKIVVPSERSGVRYYKAVVTTDGVCVKKTLFAQKSRAKDWFGDHKVYDPLVIVDHSFDKKDVNAQSALKRAVENGIVINDMLYVSAFASPSQIRKANSVWIRADIAKDFKKWAVVETKISTLPIVKQSQLYTVDTFATTDPWEHHFPEDVFGKILPCPNPAKIAIFDDFTRTEEERIAEVIEDALGATLLKTIKSVEETKTDGQAFVVANTDAEPNWEDILTPEVTMGMSVRLPGIKVSAQIITREGIRVVMVKHNVDTTIPDLYGRTWGNKNMPDVIMFASGYKMSKVVKTEDDWNQFVSALTKYEMRMRICIRDHKRVSDVPAQGLQCLDMTPEEGVKVGGMAAKVINRYKSVEYAPRLVGGNLGHCAKMFHILEAEPLFYEQWRDCFCKKQREAASGRYPELGGYHMAAIDPVACIEYILGVEVKGLIPKDCVAISGHGAGEKHALSRMPENNNNFGIFVTIEIPEEYRGLFFGQTIYFSIFGIPMTDMQMDFDGDKVKDVDIEWFIKMVERAIKTQDKVPLVLRKLGKPEPKDWYGLKDWNEFITGLISAPVGLCANAATMAWTQLPNDNDNRELLIYLASELATLVIDRAKNPDGVAANNAQELISGISPYLGDALFSKCGTLKSVGMPHYSAYGKTNWRYDWDKEGIDSLKAKAEKYKTINKSKFSGGYDHNPSIEELRYAAKGYLEMTKYYDKAAKTVMSNSGLESYSKTVVELTGDAKLDFSRKMTDDAAGGKKIHHIIGGMLMNGEVNEPHQIPGLINLFSEKVSELTAAFNTLREDADEDEFDQQSRLFGEYEKEYVVGVLRRFASKYGKTYDDIVDYLVDKLYVMRYTDKPQDMQLRRILWAVFGDTMEANLRANIEAGKLERLCFEQNIPIDLFDDEYAALNIREIDVDEDVDYIEFDESDLDEFDI